MSFIGLHFGNTSTSIAVTKGDGKVDVIASPDGERAIPSALSYVGTDEYHGGQALAQLIRNPQNTIINFRDFAGVSFDKAVLPEIVNSAKAINVDGKVGYEIEEDGKTTKITVDEVIKRHFQQIKAAAEDYIGNKVEGVVLTTPTNFSDEQKKALKSATKEAGLNVLQFINEPSAALLAHLTANNKLEEDRIYVVADFGGVRSDAAVITARGGIFTILATEHNFELGGDQLDAALSEFFAKEFEKKYKANPRKTQRSLAKLKSECITTKKTLSNVQSSTISIDSLSDGFDFHSSINRLRYEVVARDIFSKMAAFVEETVRKAGLETLDIDEVLLVGGTSNTPRLASNVQFIFPESTVVVSPALDSKALDPSELICRGAALQAALIESYDEDEINQSLQPVVVNLEHIAKPIGVKNADGEFIQIISRETAYPIKRSLTFDTPGDVLIELYEGERTIEESTVEPEEGDEEYSDEEPEVLKKVVYVPGQLLAQIPFKGETANGKLEVIVRITVDGLLQATVRSGDKVERVDVHST
ncbi:hypothetical protein LJB42_000421 [Komagataella kurtzmanii]|nr:hypothetical protein LJB42_000421 [Komagataella kurtzmanii]